MPFYLAILAATFGKGSHRPVLAASIRLACLLLGAVGLGSLIGHSLGSAPNAVALPFWHIAPYATFAVEAVVAFSLLSTVGLWQAKGNLHRLLQSWPLTAWQRIIANILPYGIVVVIALALSLPVLGTVFMALGLRPASLSFCTLLGIGAAGGLFAITAARMWVGIFITPITLWIQYQVLTYVQSTAYAVGTRQRYALLFWMVTCLLLLLVPALFKTTPAQPTTSTIHDAKLPLPYFVKKALRSRSTRVSSAITVLISLGAAYVLHKQAATWQLPFSIGAILLATLVADLRSLAIRNNPVEITNLYGTARFARQQSITAVGAALCVSPLLILAVFCGGADLAPLLVSEILFVISIGLFAGTLIVPEPGDISGQCLTALLCVGVFCVPQLTPLGAWSANAQAITYFAATIIVASVAYLTEYQRNPYIWRKTYETKQ